MRSAARCLLVLALALVATGARAAVGTVAVATGKATRTPEGGTPVKLAPGAAIELRDTLRVEKGHLKLILNDQSFVLAGEGSELKIDEASFAGQERQAFSARLVLGSLWAHVKKAAAGSGAKFEIRTDRAIAGVRGTKFRVDVEHLESGSTTRVYVIDGKVTVRWRQPKSQVPNVAQAEVAQPAQDPSEAPGFAEVGDKATSRVAASGRPALRAPQAAVQQADELDLAEHTFEEDTGILVVGDRDWRVLAREPLADDSFAKFVAKHGK